MKRYLILDVAALGFDFWEAHHQSDFWEALSPRGITTIFPAVTCPVQATLRTATLPEQHGLFLNGRFDPILRKAQFWEQASNLYAGPRIWENFRKSGHTVGQLCWQQALGIDSDLLLSPAPIHKHHGGMIQDCYTVPPTLYSDLCVKLKRGFNLMNYWGPFTSLKSTQWIADAACEILSSGAAPDLFLVYLPHLDYDQQRHGPEHPKSQKALHQLESILARILEVARNQKYEVIILGDYAITPATKPVYLNRMLRQNKYLTPRIIKGAVYLDLWQTPAFAMVDHQVAHLIIQNPEDVETIQKIISETEGVARVFRPEGFPPNDLLVEAENGAWFAYPWWFDNETPPDYALHVDIHNKPGFDPCELFMDLWPLPPHVSQKAERIKGTHGRNDLPVFFGSTDPDFEGIGSILEFAQKLQSKLS